MVAEMIRREVEKVYKSKTWTEKVKKMTDHQVFAIYIRLKREGKI